MNKPNIDIPSGFAENGTKEDFPNDKILNGFDPINPDILPGDNLNKFIDDTYKGLNGVLELYEGCVLYDSTVTYTNKSLIFDITNDGIKFYHSLQNGNINHALTDTDYWEEVNLGGSSRNVGEIISSTLPLTEAGLHLLDGTLLPYGIYKEFIDYMADLYAENPSANYFTTEALWQQSVTTYGVCGKFVYDSVNNTVRLPKITGIIEGTTDINALGDLVRAGLPNITGSGHLSNGGAAGNDIENPIGAFYRDTSRVVSKPWTQTSSTPDTIPNIGFNASLSNSIYGNSSTVQPQTIKAFYYIVIANSTKTEIQSDIDEIATDLNGKADTDLTNITDTGYIKMAGASMPSNTYIDLTLGASGTTYTAPADGWFVIGKSTVAGSTGDINIYINGVWFSSNVAPEGGWTISAIVPVKKNDVLTINYSTSGATQFFRFVYAEGSKWEAQ